MSVPKLRFPGFEGEWEEKRLGEIGPVSMCKRIFKEETELVGDVPFFKIGTFGSKPDAYISRKKFDEYKTKYPYPEVGEILISAAGTIGRTVIYDGADSYFQDSNIVWIANDETKVSNSYLALYYQIIRWTTENTTIARLYNANLKSKKITVPSLPEQKKIAAFLGVVDAKIAALRARREGLTRYKRGLMQALFSRRLRFTKPDGSAFPDWEEKRLSDFADDKRNNSFTDGDWIESPYITDDGVRLIQTGNVGVGKFKDRSKRYVSDQSFDELSCKEVEVGDLLICRLAEPAGRACVVPDLGERKMITSVDVTIVKVDKDVSSAYFLSEYFGLDRTLYEVATLCGGSTRARISRSNLGKMKVPLPHLDEQRLIANALSAMDAKIEAVANQITRIRPVSPL